MEIAGAGFINFFLASDAQADVVRRIHEQGDAFGRNGSGGGRKVIVEFVSSNPTGPLHVGHGRHGAFGASVSNLLDANGYAVHREYYINDAGRQMDILAVSIWLRYLEACGEKFRFPANGYKGEYIREIAADLLQKVDQRLVRPEGEVFGNLPPDEPEGGDKDAYIDAVIARARDADRRGRLSAKCWHLGLKEILGDIEQDLRRIRRALRPLVLGSARWPRTAPSIARWRACASRTTCTKRTARCGSAPPPSATRRIAWWCARTA